MIHQPLCIVAAVVSVALGATPVGVVTGGGIVTLSGVRISVGLLPSLLLVIDDEVTTSNAPAFIGLADRSRVVLYENSEMKLEHKAGHLTLHLMRGSLGFHLATGSSLQVTTQGSRVERETGGYGFATADPGRVKDRRKLDVGSLNRQRWMIYDRWAPVTVLEKLGKSCPPEKPDQAPDSQCGPGSVF